MIINWYGEGCFKIQVSDTVLLVDPFQNSSGLTPPRFKTDAVIETLTALPFEEKKVEARHIRGAGDYEVKGIEISGWTLSGESDEKNLKTVYLINAEDIRMCFLGNMSAPDNSFFENLGEVDILFIPAGGKPFLSQEEAAKMIKQIGPKIVVPSFFKVPGLSRKAEGVEAFLKEVEQKAEPQEKLVIKKKDLPAKMQVVTLKI